MHEVKGVLHIHSSLSDGAATIKYIAESSKASGIDFAIVTDHDKFEENKARSGWYDGVLLLAGQEISPVRNHYLALAIKKHIDRRGKRPQHFINDVKEQGGLGFIPHPLWRWRPGLFWMMPHPWTSWEVKDFTGFEVWSYMHDWTEDVNIFNLPLRYAAPCKAINGPRREMLALWDKMCLKRRVVGLGGLDAHAPRLFPYEKLFKTIRTHLLLKEPFSKKFEEDENRLYEAMREGRCFMANDSLADSTGFRFEFAMADKTYDIGEEVEITSKGLLRASSPVLAEVKILRDGKCITKSNCRSLEMYITLPGVYRAEAYLNGKGWVFTNPIYVRGGNGK